MPGVPRGAGTGEDSGQEADPGKARGPLENMVALASAPAPPRLAVAAAVVGGEGSTPEGGGLGGWGAAGWGPARPRLLLLLPALRLRPDLAHGGM